MSKMKPIKNKEKIRSVKKTLKKQGMRNYMLFEIGINTGMKIKDLLPLKVKDIKNRDYIEKKNKQTGEVKYYYIPEKVKDKINEYTKNKKSNDYVFKSQRGENKPISRVQAYRILKKAFKKAGIKSCGTETMRKTYGYFHYIKYKNIAVLQELYNHSQRKETLQYLDINIEKPEGNEDIIRKENDIYL